MSIIHYFIVSIIAIILGQLASHFNKKLPPVVKEEITYKEFFSTLTKDFKLDIKYTLVFLVVFNLLLYFSGASLKLYLYLFVIFALSIVTSVDIRFQLIPDEVHILIFIVGLINIAFDFQNAWNYIFGAALGGGIFLGLGLLSLIIFKKEGMGFGDVKLMLALGFLFGVKNVLVITLVSFVFGALIGGALLILKKKDSDGYIPFGPFIALGALILMFVPAGNIIDIYISFCTWLGYQISDVVFWIADKFNLISY